jgi:hypothetical protein
MNSRDKLGQELNVGMPTIKPPPNIEFDLDDKVGVPKRMDGQRASFLCTLDWSWSPVNERRESYYLQQCGAYWVLWLKQYDDNWGRWEKPTAIARCLREGIGFKAAAMILLAEALAEDIRRYDSDLDRFHEITDTGELSMDEIQAIGDAVWADH